MNAGKSDQYGMVRPAGMRTGRLGGHAPGSFGLIDADETGGQRVTGSQ